MCVFKDILIPCTRLGALSIGICPAGVSNCGSNIGDFSNIGRVEAGDCLSLGRNMGGFLLRF